MKKKIPMFRWSKTKFSKNDDFVKYVYGVWIQIKFGDWSLWTLSFQTFIDIDGCQLVLTTSLYFLF